MTKKQIITIAGKPGSGKSTTSNKVASALSYEHFSSGDLFRAIAKDKGIDINEINTLAESEKSIDHAVDEKLQEMGRTKSDLVIDSRMAWHWMPESFKVYLDLDLNEAAKRIISTMNPERLEVEKIPSNPTKYTESLQNRLDSETKRYQDLYQANPYDTNNYDLVVDTFNNGPDEVVEIILSAYKKWSGE